MKRLVLVVACLVWLGQLGWAGLANGQGETRGQSLAVNPAIMEQILEPGQPISSKIVITNISDVPIPIKASVSDFKPNEDLEGVDDAGIYQAQTWFKIDEPDFILQPKQAREVRVLITAPLGAEPGGHYATVFFQSLIPEEFVSSDRVYLANRVGVLAFLVVKGDIKEKLAVGSLAAPSLQQFAPVEFSLTLKNEGNVHVLPSGKLKIFNWRGKQIDEIVLKPGMVLPRTTREFRFVLDKAGPVGTYTARAEIAYGSDSQQLASATVRIWVVPWVLVLTIVVVGLPLGWLLLRIKRRGRRVWRALRGRDARFRG